MLAVVQEDFTVAIIDLDTLKTVRLFSGHSNTITDLVRFLFCWFVGWFGWMVKRRSYVDRVYPKVKFY
jgi:hypothetical protein